MFIDKSHKKLAPKIPVQRRRQKLPIKSNALNADHRRATPSEGRRYSGVDSNSVPQQADKEAGEQSYGSTATHTTASEAGPVTADSDGANADGSRGDTGPTLQQTALATAVPSNVDIVQTEQGSQGNVEQCQDQVNDNLHSSPHQSASRDVGFHGLPGESSAHTEQINSDPVLDDGPEQQLNNDAIDHAQFSSHLSDDPNEDTVQAQHLEQGNGLTQGEHVATVDNVSVTGETSHTVKRRLTHKRKAKSSKKELSEAPRKRRRREERSKTPEDAEDREIAPATVRMQELCKDQRIGRKSKLEQSMRQIDWSEVVRKRKEAARVDVTTQGQKENAVNERLDRAARERESAHHGGPQLRIVNGQMVVDQASLIVDRRAEASRNDDTLEEVEEDDLTARVNSHSWLYDNRRDPAERGRPLKSDRWTSDQTEAFYDALRMFGTDFYIISCMFPGKTRRQIKLKFVREEKSNPAAVKAALVGETVPMNFDAYLAATGQGEESFKDPKELEAELRAEDDKHKEEIEKRKEEHAELMRQRKAAGADTDGDVPESLKENKRGKGKKSKKTTTKKKPPLQPRGGEEVEILGDA